VSLFLLVSVSWPATPKSASFTSPTSERSTLAAVTNQDRGNLIQGLAQYSYKRIHVESILLGGREKVSRHVTV
jgi:hypothetical protein